MLHTRYCEKKIPAMVTTTIAAVSARHRAAAPRATITSSASSMMTTNAGTFTSESAPPRPTICSTYMRPFAAKARPSARTKRIGSPRKHCICAPALMGSNIRCEYAPIFR